MYTFVQWINFKRYVNRTPSQFLYSALSSEPHSTLLFLPKTLQETHLLEQRNIATTVHLEKRSCTS